MPAYRLDGHVHLVGDGSLGDGCWKRREGFIRQLASRGMAHFGGLPASALRSGLDQAYRDLLRRYLATSSLHGLVILAMDHVYLKGEKREDLSPFYIPNDVVLRWAREEPGFLAAVSIHPGRPDALDELDRCAEQGAALVKFLPNVHQIDLTNPEYDSFWQRMAERGLLLLSHTGGEHALPNYRPEWANPELLSRPADCGVTVIAAHCGGRAGLLDRDYTTEFLSLIERYPRVYGDISALNLPLRARGLRRLMDSSLHDRLIHGSDFPVPVLGQMLPLLGLINQADYRRCRKIRNPLERDWQLKRACGFPETVATRLFSMIPPTAQKLFRPFPHPS